MVERIWEEEARITKPSNLTKKLHRKYKIETQASTGSLDK
jgi:hypothetical protein